MRVLVACLALLAVPAALAMPVADPVLPGDVAPEGSPDGAVDVGDVLLALGMSVGTAEIDMNADVAPSEAFGSSRLVLGDEAIDVQDVLLILRVAVGLETLAGGFEVTSRAELDQVGAAVFSYAGLDAVLKDVFTLSELPPLNVPTEADCPAGGITTTLLGVSSQSVEGTNCDTGEFLINGEASRGGSLQDELLDFEASFELVHAAGSLSYRGVIALQTAVEFEPGRTGTAITGMLTVTTDHPDDLELGVEIDIIDPDDGDWPVGTIWFAVQGGAAIELSFDGSSTAVATVTDGSGTSSYSIDLVTGVISSR